MKKETMGSGAAMGLHSTSAFKAYAWLWHSWLEAQRELPVLRWLSLGAAALAATALYLAVAQGDTVLTAVIDGMVAALFALLIPAIYYLLFEIYRKHRSDAIFDSKRLAHLIQRIAHQEIEASEEAKLALENTLLMLKPESSSKQR